MKVIVLGILATIITLEIFSQEKIATNVKFGIWTDSSIWQSKKIPDSNTVIFLSSDIIVNSSVSCAAVQTNGYKMTVNSGVTLSIKKNIKREKDSLIIYNIPSAYNTDTLQAIYKLNNIEFSFYGRRDNAGNIENISTAQFRIENSNDTVVNVMYDDSLRVTLLYLSVNGVKDSTLLKFSYSDSIVFVSRFHVNWNNNTILFRDVSVAKRKGQSYSAYLSRNANALSFGAEEFATAIAGIVGATLIITVGTAAFAAGLVAIAGYSAAAITNAAIVGAVIGFVTAINPANAAESTNFTFTPYVNNLVNYINLITTNPSLLIQNWLGSFLPVVSTKAPNDIRDNTAFSGGDILSTGGLDIIEKGVCWGTSPNPTIANNKTTQGTVNVWYISYLTDLDINQTYFVRAYITNAAGTSYGNTYSFKTGENSFIDPRDGQQYPYKQIGTQVWMTKNLNYAANGSWCYDNDAANCTTYGRLYNWNTALIVAPPGWHLPSDEEWATLINYLGGNSVAGGKMRSINGWNGANAGATNSSGFTGLPGGAFGKGSNTSPSFFSVGFYAYWWSSTPYDLTLAWYRGLYWTGTVAIRGGSYYTDGLSIRCVKD